MEISVNDVYMFMDVITKYQEYEDIIEETKNFIINAKKEQEVINIVNNAKSNICKWYNSVLLKSIIVLFILIFITYMFHKFCLNIVGELIYNLILSFLIMILIYVISYIFIKIYKKDNVKKNLFKEVDDIAFRLGIKYEQVYGF